MEINRANKLSQIDEWYSSIKNTALLVTGIPSAGKTFLIKKWLSSRAISNTFIDTEKYESIKEVFEENFDGSVSSSINILNALFGEKTLGEVVVFDGIKPGDAILNKIKKMCSENEHKYILITEYADYLFEKSPFIPVGFLTLLHIAPLTFREFCEITVAKNIINSTLIDLCDEYNKELYFYSIFQKKWEEYSSFGGLPGVLEKLYNQGEYAAKEELNTVWKIIYKLVNDLPYKTPSKILNFYDSERSGSYGRFVFTNISKYDNYGRNEKGFVILKKIGIVNTIKFSKTQLNFSYYDVYLTDLGLENNFVNITRAHIAESAIFNSFSDKRNIFREVRDRNTVIDFFVDSTIPEIIKVKSKITFGLENLAQKIATFNPTGVQTRKAYILVDSGFRFVKTINRVRVMPIWAYLLLK